MSKKYFAQNLIPCPDGTMADPTIGCAATPSTAVSPETSIVDVLLNVAGVLMALVAAVATALLILGAVRYALAAGDDEKIKRAKRTMLWSVIGLVIALLARALVQFFLATIA